MKKTFYAMIIVLIVSLCGCASFPLESSGTNSKEETIENDSKSDKEETAENDSKHNSEKETSGKKEEVDNSALKVETLKSWSFQRNTGTNDYSLFFGLCDKKGNAINANVDVDIRIVNDKGEEVFNSTKSVTKDDFSYYTSQVAGEQYLANVRISVKEIMSGKSSSGTVYLTVYKGDVLAFDEVNCSAFYCLPINDIQLTAKSLPMEISLKGYDEKVTSKIQIDSISFEFEKEYSPRLTITITGSKTYGTNDSYGMDLFGYKLYDSEGYLVDSGSVYLRALSKGDKFKDNSIVIYDVTPGETYVIDFVENIY